MSEKTRPALDEAPGSTAVLENGSGVPSPVHLVNRLDSTGGQDGRDESLNRILSAVVAFRDGDFSVRLPLNWPGIEGRIAEAFNQTIAQEERIANEVTRLSVTVGKEGRLKQRL